MFATAHPHKHHLLQQLGVAEDHIASSRNLDFRAAFLDVTGGHGLDVVLDCLAGDFVDASLDLLPEGGCFVEIGKTDIRDPHTIADAHPGVTYHAFDLSSAAPDQLSRLLTHLHELFTTDVLHPLPTTGYDLRHAVHAFRDMSQARHTGKIVLTPTRRLDTTGTVLITGGTGTLGGLVAEHLVTAHGVTHLVLVSRRGRTAAGAVELAQRLTELGADVQITACDVADPAALAALLASVPPEHPLTAVVHTAAILADAPVTDLTPDGLHQVLATKTDTAWWLHELTAHLDLAAFVMFSSLAGVLGSPGQANYAAANTALDALAEHRHRLGLPAVSIAWGYWDTPTGLTGHLSERDRARITAAGLAPITPATGLALLDQALTGGIPAVAAAPLDTRALIGRAHAATLPPILSALIPATRRRAHTTAAATATLPARLGAMTPDQQHRHLLELVATATATVLGHPDPHRYRPQRPVQRPRYRLTDRPGTTQPPHPHHRPGPAAHPGLRPSHPHHPRLPPAQPAHRPPHRPGRGRGGRGPRR